MNLGICKIFYYLKNIFDKKNFRFNIPHDDEHKCGEFMSLEKENYHIMAPTLEYNTNPWSWSRCSAHMLNKFLESVLSCFNFF